MRLIDADALYRDICDSMNEMTEIGIAVDAEWMWAKLNDALENAPTIEPERKKGQWIMHISDVFPTESTMECDQCHAEQPITCDNSFCPNCGAYM